jgi:NADH-quinone oxidoreductase subunit H
MNVPLVLLRLLIFPGLLYGLLAGWLMLWVERKLAARVQRRLGPPFYQPFFDFIKLLSKRSSTKPRLEEMLLSALPILSVGAVIGALALLPIFPQESGFAGDLVLFVALLEIPSICTVLAGFASRSLFGEIGATREAVVSAAYNLPFLMGIVALAAAAGSLRLSDIAAAPIGPIRLLALLAVLLCLPAKLRLNPFSLPNAEQEIYSGPLTELGGAPLAFWELTHGLEWVALTGFIGCLLLPPGNAIILNVLLLILISFVLVLLLAGLAAGTARLKITQATRFYWRWGAAAAALALLIAGFFPKGG